MLSKLALSQTCYKGEPLGDSSPSLRFGASGDAVGSLQRRLVQLGFEVAQLELDSKQFGESTRKAVAALQHRNGLLTNGIVDGVTRSALDSDAKLAHNTARIHGAITFLDGTPLASSTVQLLAQSHDNEARIGRDSKTDETGWYTIDYPESAAAVGLVVRALDGNGAMLGESAVLFRAPRIATVDITLPRAAAGRSELERIATAVDQAFPSSTTEQPTADQIEFLAQAIGSPAIQIAQYVLARRLGAAYRAPAEVFYVLARAGLLPTDGPLSIPPANQLREAIDDAVRTGRIPPPKSDLVEALATAFRERLLAAQGSPFAATMTAARVDATSQHRIADAMARTRTVTAVGDAAPRAQLAFELDELTSHHAPLIAELVDGSNVQSFRDLTRLTPTDWDALVKKVGAPNGVDTAAYARSLYDAVEAKLPTATFVARLSAAASAPDAGSFAAAHAPLVSLLAKHPDFDLVTGHVEKLLPRSDGESPATTQLRDDVKRVQRLLRVAPRFDDISALSQAGFRSASGIVRFGKERFVAVHSETLGGNARAQQIFDNAAAQHALALARFGRFSRSLNPVELPVLSTPATTLISRAIGLGDVFPDYQDLFGPFKLCDCENCRSVVGPAAYLVDLLSFLQTIPVSGTQTALDLLTQRRPEITQIDLTCANSNTALPEIDLINEILENTAIMSSSFGSPPPDNDRQTTRGEDVLAVSPEYVNRFVYDYVLPTAVSPWTLPFDLGTEQSRTYLGQLGIQRSDLMSVFQGPAGPSDADIAADRLALSVVEHFLITHGPYSFKTPVRVTGTNIDPANPPTVIDGVTLADGDRVLLAIPFNSPKNGIYVYSAGKLTRAADAADGSQLGIGTAVQVTEGTVFAGRTWILTSYQPIKIDTTPLNFIIDGQQWKWWATIFIADITSFIQYVANFLDSASIDLAALEALLQTSYVNPTGDLRIVFGTDSQGDLSCDLFQAVISNLNGRTAAATRMLRFLRLQRRLGWTAHEIDEAITIFNATEIDDPFLVRVVELRDLASTLGLAIIEAEALFGTIDTANAQTSLYETVFRNPAVVDPPPTIFDLNAQRNELAVASQGLKISDYTLSLIAPLGISSADLSLLVPAQVPDLLTLANLSSLYRYARFAQALSITIGDLLELVQLTGLDPFNIDATRTFLDHKVVVDKSGFSVAALRYLLQQQDVVASGLAPDAAAAALILVNARTALNTLAQQTRPPVFDATALPDLVADTLGRVLPAAQATTAFAIVNTAAPPSAADQAFIQQYLAPFWDPATAIAFLTTDLVVADRLEETLSRLTNDHYLDPLVAALKTDFAKIFKADLVELAVDVTLGRRSSADTTQFIAAQFPLFMDAAAVAAAQTALAVDDTKPAPNGQKLRARITFVLPYLADYLFRSGAYALLQQTFGTALGISSKSLRLLLDSVLLPNPTPQSLYSIFTSAAFLASTGTDASDPQLKIAVDAYTLLSKVAVLVARLHMTVDDIAAVGSVPAAANILSWSELPLVPTTSATIFDAWLRLTLMLDLAKREPGGRTAVYALLTAPPTSPNLLTLAAAVFNVTTTALDAVVAQLFGPAQYNALLDVALLMRIDRALYLAKRCNVSPQTIIEGWVGPYVLSADADALKQSVKARYDHDTWLAVAKPLQNQLRERQRDALKALLDGTVFPLFIFDPANYWTNYLLVDLETSSAVPASRIQNATLTIQRLVQRSFLGLELFQLSEDQTKQWSWMSQYPLWQANREVFLYPENWLDPTLRTDKTELFANLESALAQKDVTSEAAADALFGYLTDLVGLSNLVILNGTDTFFDDIRTRHVVARTPFRPYRFYHRYQTKAVGGDAWSPWTQIDIDIQSDDILLSFLNGRLYMLWPTFSGESPDTQTVRGPAQPQPHQAGPTEPRPLVIGLSWAEYRNGTWTNKQSGTADQLLHTSPILNAGYGSGYYLADPTTISDENRYWFDVAYQPDGLQVVVRFNTAVYYSIFGIPDFGLYTATFTFKAGSAGGLTVPVILSPTDLHISDWKFQAADPRAPGTKVGAGLYTTTPVGDRFVDNTPDGTSDALVLPISNWSATTTVLDTPPHKYWLLSEEPQSYFPLFQGSFFFFQDTNRCFLVDEFLYWNAANKTTSLLASQTTAFSSVQQVLDAVRPLATPDAFAGEQWRYLFNTFYHPYVLAFLAILDIEGPDVLFSRTVEGAPYYEGADPSVFFLSYGPRPTTVMLPFPREDVDFSLAGPYSEYNWELFFHAPLLIADRLMKNQRFAEARRWLQYIFNPTDSSDKPPPAKYWTFYPFYADAAGLRTEAIEDLLASLDDPTDPRHAQMVAAVRDWQLNPFDPHRIARLRLSAYSKQAFMKYLDNLIAWGDSLFRQNTTETINQAAQLYLLAADLLGPKPPDVTLPAEPATANFSQLAAKLDAFSNAVVPYENLPSTGAGGAAGPPVVIGNALEFCIPKNEKLLGYWTTIADRLFKIRHSMDIDGHVEQLPLFPPPIDPALLVAAEAAGVDLSSALADLDAPLPSYRFTAILQKANELCGDVKALGQAMLQAMEKRDAEALSVLRSTQEIVLLQAVRANKERAVSEAQANLVAQQRARDAVQARYDFYSKIAFMNTEEQAHFESMAVALSLQNMAHALELEGSLLRLIPDFVLGVSGLAATPVSTASFGGEALSKIASIGASALEMVASNIQGEAMMQQVLGGYRRRADDWALQAQLASVELEQADQAIAAGRLRADMAQQDLDNQDLQIANAQTVDTFLRSKFTNQNLYDYMVGVLSDVYFQTYQLAYSTAKQAQRAFHREIGDPTASYVQHGRWDSLKKGLLAGEMLQFDLRRMESDYLDRNIREFELTKTISLALFAPEMLLQLRETGSCSFTLPEAIFDYDYPGHYLRRLKSVSLTLPCVVGPYTNVNCTLTLLKDTVRIDSSGANYAPSGPNDARFWSRTGAVQAIATSGGQSDSGLFELNFRDERYLPFEGAGVINSWRLDLPLETNLFDRRTLTDVIIHLRYTARDGGDALRTQALSVVRDAKRTAFILVSSAQQFATAWQQFLYPGDGPTDNDQTLTLDLDATVLPFSLPGKTARVKDVAVVLKLDPTVADQYDDTLKMILTAPSATVDPANAKALARDTVVGGLPRALYLYPSPAYPGQWTVTVREADLAGSAGGLSGIVWTTTPGGHNRLIPSAIDDLLLVVEVMIA